ncbi:glycerophosphoryl diester phosphodiesterase [Larkinella arboricola]|uniref:Glycerophosphoryl diester phosphodiesterase n=1 Tax=Larkinella arboricola TaxID=643671 RepID=A0A327WU46_LARAB|nr:glycerophosphodiester phosphodiesterase family protein [Larkinella arboricola]RAJ94571.1 glycerophosphoryl diester phosphodiesterase [Larkinella arboricola]
MKRFLLVALTVSLLAGCAPKTVIHTYRVPAGGLSTFLNYTPGRAPMISAHRGGGDIKGYPENCIESFEYLAKRLPVIIECDIDLTRDSVLVMMHDQTLDRTTTGTGKLIEKTYDEIRQYRLEDNFGNVTKFSVPTLEQVLRWGKDKVVYTLDVKKNVPFAKVVEMVRRTGAADYSVIITYNATQAAEVYRLDPNLMLSVTIMKEEDYQRLHDLGIPDRNMVAFVGVREPRPELYKFLHEKGISCILGTLGNLDKQAVAKGDQVYKTFANNGADIMSTDRPIEVYQAVK